ncbi:Urea ABC transporter, ATPase protein UrtD [Olavius algarvensis Delta 1 endosymbiont]|nr:Urea ABC transporter, ATPase protein UrtD [Olavius algarvensis Delta 1 endosymbiont]
MQCIFETQGITKQFGGLTAVDHVDLKLRAGDLQCIIGPNGCGKTTLFNLITGHYKPSSGKVFFSNQDITAKPVHVISKLGIVRKFQIPGIFEQLTVYENIRVPFFANQRQSMFVGSRVDSDSHQKIMEQLSDINLVDKADELAINLAHGQKQWLEIGMVLASKPRLMLLDEPTAGMTVAETHQTAELIQEISKSTGITILVIEHDIRFVKEIASRITVMYKGAIFREGSYQEINSDDAVREIYLGRHR